MSPKVDIYDEMQKSYVGGPATSAPRAWSSAKRLQHCDGRGLDVLMHDYLGLADEVEEFVLPLAAPADGPEHDTEVTELKPHTS